MVSGSPGHTPGAEASRKLLAVLMAFNEARPVRSVPELAADVGVPLSSAYRYVASCARRGCSRSRPAATASTASPPASLALARAAAATDAARGRSPARTSRRCATRSTRPSCSCAAAGDAVVCIDRAESPARCGCSSSCGQTMPAPPRLRGPRAARAPRRRTARDSYLDEVRADAAERPAGPARRRRPRRGRRETAGPSRTRRSTTASGAGGRRARRRRMPPYGVAARSTASTSRAGPDLRPPAMPRPDQRRPRQR